MAEERKDETPEETEELEDDSRRDFISKAVAGVGAAAIAGIVAEAATGEAEGQGRPVARMGEATALKTQAVRNQSLKMVTLEKGRSLELRGKQLGEVLAREGLKPEGVLGDEAVMSLSLIWD